MKTPNKQLELLRALIKLSGRSARQHAMECGVTYTNFSAALRGKRSFPEAKWPILLLQLGIPGMALDTDKVHCWKIGADLESLKVATAHLFPAGAFLEGVWREGGGAWDMRRVMDSAIFAISDGKCRILLKRTGVGFLLHLNPEPVTPDTIPQLHWRTGHADIQTLISLPGENYGKWELGQITVEEFDTAWQSQKIAPTWEQVIAFAQASQLSPKVVMDILKSHQEIR